jgi:transcriptional regulator with XRE-family HTH domain
MANLLELGEKVKQARKTLRLTQRELASICGVSRARIEALENQRIADIGFKNLLRIMNAVGLDLRVTDLNRQRPTLDDLVADQEAAGHDPRMVR